MPPARRFMRKPTPQRITQTPTQQPAITQNQRRMVSTKYSEVNRVVSVANRVMLAHTAMLNGQLSEMDLRNISEAMQQYPYVDSRYDGHESHFFTTNNPTEIANVLQALGQRIHQIRNTISNLMDDMDAFVGQYVNLQ